MDVHKGAGTGKEQGSGAGTSAATVEQRTGIITGSNQGQDGRVDDGGTNHYCSRT